MKRTKLTVLCALALAISTVAFSFSTPPARAADMGCNAPPPLCLVGKVLGALPLPGKK